MFVLSSSCQVPLKSEFLNRKWKRSEFDVMAFSVYLQKASVNQFENVQWNHHKCDRGRNYTVIRTSVEYKEED